MNRWRALVAMGTALCLMTAPTHGEAPERSALKRTRPKLQLNLALQPMAPGLASRSPLLQDCPTTAGDWATWRDAAIDLLLAPRLGRADDTAAPGPYLDFDQLAYQSFAVANRLEDCERISAIKPPDDIVGNLRSMATALAAQTGIDNQFGHGGFDAQGDPLYDDRHYLDVIRPLVELPCLLTQPSFLDALAQPATYHQAMAWLDQRNQGQTVLGCANEGGQWATLLYKSAVLGTPDEADAFGRLLVVVPGETRDKWIQFGIKADADDNPKDRTIQNVSIVSVPVPAASQPAPYTAMIDWFRVKERGPDGVERLTLKTRYETLGRTGNCMLCHKTPVIGIHPERVYTLSPQHSLVEMPPAEATAALQRINDWLDIRRYGPATQAVSQNDAFAQPERYGPPLGPSAAAHDLSATRSPQAMRACAGDAPELTDARLMVIARQMNCARCHNNGTPTGGNTGHAHVGAINLPVAGQYQRDVKLADGAWPNLLYRYIKDGLMPPPEDDQAVLPTETERLALYNCLQAEYHNPSTGQGLLRDWLQQKPLPPPVPKP